MYYAYTIMCNVLQVHRYPPRTKLILKVNKKLQATAGPDGGCYGDYNAAPVTITPNQTVTFSPNSTDELV